MKPATLNMIKESRVITLF